MNCPNCGTPINPAAALGSITSPAKAAAARENAKRLRRNLGGKKRGRKSKEVMPNAGDNALHAPAPRKSDPSGARKLRAPILTGGKAD